MNTKPLALLALAASLGATYLATPRAEAAQKPNRVLTVDQIYELFYIAGRQESHQPGSAHVIVSGEYLHNVGPDEFERAGSAGGIIVTGTHPLSQLTEEPRPGASEILCEYGPAMLRRAHKLRANSKIVMRGVLTFADNVSDTAGETVALHDCTF